MGQDHQELAAEPSDDPDLEGHPAPALQEVRLERLGDEGPGREAQHDGVGHHPDREERTEARSLAEAGEGNPPPQRLRQRGHEGGQEEQGDLPPEGLHELQGPAQVRRAQGERKQAQRQEPGQDL